MGDYLKYGLYYSTDWCSEYQRMKIQPLCKIKLIKRVHVINVKKMMEGTYARALETVVKQV
jgi:hypothetical protein